MAGAVALDSAGHEYTRRVDTVPYRNTNGHDSLAAFVLLTSSDGAAQSKPKDQVQERVFFRQVIVARPQGVYTPSTWNRPAP